MALVRSFPPIAAPDARVLILGSMPGDASLRAGQYYAHPRNLFWRILGDILGQPLPDLAYPERTLVLQQHRIAVWDVLHSCERHGSLDSAIDPATMRANDFAGFFREHPAIALVLFNGGMAASSFRRYARPQLGDLQFDCQPLDCQPLDCQRLPSTSPAHAALAYGAKLAQWREKLSVIRSNA